MEKNLIFRIVQDQGILLDLESIGKTNNDKAMIKNLQSQYQSSTTPASKSQVLSQLKNEILSSVEPITDKITRDSTKLDSLAIELSTINCTNILVQKWKQVIEIYIKFIQTDSISQANRSTLALLAQECSDEYGDAIHLARALANTFTSTYYDVNDDCLQQSTPRSKVENIDDVDIRPNPSSGTIYIQWPSLYSGTAYLYNTEGKQLRSIKISNSFISEMDISDLSGVIYLKFVSQDGDVINKKVIVIK